ncbi:MAG: hypothetical protein U0V64_01305 [Cyclobacteriaceae bacterium]
MEQKQRNRFIERVKDLYVFSKLERIVAAFCMGIPFFLILADAQDQVSLPGIAYGIFVIMLVPLVISIAAFQINKLSTGRGSLWFGFTFLLITALFYSWLKILPAGYTARESISDYVRMNNAQSFGMLLTIASMLFIFNGAVYAHKTGLTGIKRHGQWYNILLGLFLLCVVLFPVSNEHLKFFHYLFAISFYAGSGIIIIFLNDRQHRKLSYFIVILMAAGFVLFSFHVGPFTLFWAETIGLWVIGMHYILESLGSE